MSACDASPLRKGSAHLKRFSSASGVKFSSKEKTVQVLPLTVKADSEACLLVCLR
jgi:hypothetical protein